MKTKQKILVGTLTGSTAIVLIGTIIVFPPMIIIGGIGIGLSLRKRLFFKKKKQVIKKELMVDKKQVIKKEPLIKNGTNPLLITSGKIDSFKF